jgi:hypothetical protein
MSHCSALNAPPYEPPKTTTVLVGKVVCMDVEDRWDAFVVMDMMQDFEEK